MDIYTRFEIPFEAIGKAEQQLCEVAEYIADMVWLFDKYCIPDERYVLNHDLSHLVQPKRVLVHPTYDEAHIKVTVSDEEGFIYDYAKTMVTQHIDDYRRKVHAEAVTKSGQMDEENLSSKLKVGTAMLLLLRDLCVNGLSDSESAEIANSPVVSSAEVVGETIRKYGIDELSFGLARELEDMCDQVTPSEVDIDLYESSRAFVLREMETLPLRTRVGLWLKVKEICFDPMYKSPE